MHREMKWHKFMYQAYTNVSLFAFNKKVRFGLITFFLIGKHLRSSIIQDSRVIIKKNLLRKLTENYNFTLLNVNCFLSSCLSLSLSLSLHLSLRLFDFIFSKLIYVFLFGAAFMIRSERFPSC